MNRDLVFGSAMLALAAAYHRLAAQIPESQLADAVGPQGLPRIYAYALGGLALVLIVQSLGSLIRHLGVLSRESRASGPLSHVPSPDSRAPSPESGASGPEPHAPRPASRVLRPAGVVAIGAIYIAVVPWLGYLLSVAGLIAASIAYQGGGANRRVAMIAVSGALVFWLLFVVLLGIQHPSGIWPEMFGGQ